MITAKEYAQRRKKLMKQLGPDAVAVVSAAPTVLRTESADYPYRQNNHFAYLCGFPEPEATLVITPKKSILFCQEKNPEKEIWTGRIIGQDEAKSTYGFDEAFSNKQLESQLPILTEGKTVYDASGKGESLNPILSEMRLVKSAAEIDLMKKAASISALAHKTAMQSVRPGMNESELAAIYEYEFKKNGGTGLAYGSIVGGGGNACILHYQENNQVLNDGELVLVDAACEYEWFAADITRTYPVNGVFSGPQRDIYELVLLAQKNAINMIKPGIPWESVQEHVVQDITQGLIDLALLKGNCDDLIETKAYRRFYMHNCGHWLGLDVHDVGAYKVDDQPRLLEANMVVTVEPGIYISPADDIDKHWHNIGVRIEDDVQVTDKAFCVLSFEAPKEIDEIEACMSHRKSRVVEQVNS